MGKKEEIPYVASDEFLEKEKNTVVELFHKGLSYRKIEAQTGVDFYWIRKWLNEAGIYKKNIHSRETWTIEKIKLLAADRGGVLISDTYRNMHSPLLWWCGKEDHPSFWAELNSVSRSRSWCPKCWNARRSDTMTKINLSDLKRLASERGGKCNDSSYRSGRKISWTCLHGHTFSRTWSEVSDRNRWCDVCKPFRSQELTRQIFQAIFKKPFARTTLGKLGFSEGKKLELDGYNPELNMAFEYNGELHYEEKFSSRKALEEVRANDRKKANLCMRYGITLIVVKYFPRDRKVDHWKYIEQVLEAHKVEVPAYDRVISLEGIFYDKYYSEIREIVEQRGGKLVSQQVLNATTAVQIKCEYGHIFPMTPQKIKQGQWCRHGMKSRPLTEKELQKTVELFGGTFITLVNGVDGERKVHYYCDEGHFQSKPPRRLREGRWCSDKQHKLGGTRQPINERFDDLSPNRQTSI